MGDSTKTASEEGSCSIHVEGLLSSCFANHVEETGRERSFFSSRTDMLTKYYSVLSCC